MQSKENNPSENYDKRIDPDERDRAKSKAEADKFSKKLIEFRRLTVGERYVNASVSGLSLKNGDQEKLVLFMRKPKNFLVFCGNPGIGKTYFCSALMEWALKTFQSVRYHNEKELLARLRQAVKESYDDYGNVLKYLMDDDLIILDDVGSQKYSEWTEEIIFDTLDMRYNSMKPTIVTSNLSEKDFRDRFHHRIPSRLFATENIILDGTGFEDLRNHGF